MTAHRPPRWMGWVLTLAGVYNLTWGTLVLIAPQAMLRATGLERPDTPLNYPEVWQCLGMVLALYGLAYLFAATDAYRYWPIVLVGFLGKSAGPIGVLHGIATGRFSWDALWINVSNDIIWILPFFLILRGAYRASYAVANAPVEESLAVSLERATTSTGTNLLALSHAGPTLVVFLRHFGCTFCREALADLAKLLPRLREQGVTLALVHMGTPGEAREFLGRYGLGEVAHVSDPECQLYRAFGLKRAGVSALVSPRTWARGATIFTRHGFGVPAGDVLRLPGVFLIERGAIVRAYRHDSPEQVPDYLELAGCPVPGVTP